MPTTRMRLSCGELQQQRRLVVARHAPRGPHVDQRHRALEIGAGVMPGTGAPSRSKPGDRRQRRVGHRPPDQRRRQFRRIAGAEPEQKQRGEREEQHQRQQHDQPAPLDRRGTCPTPRSCAASRERRVTPCAFELRRACAAARGCRASTQTIKPDHDQRCDGIGGDDEARRAGRDSCSAPRRGLRLHQHQRADAAAQNFVAHGGDDAA